MTPRTTKAVTIGAAAVAVVAVLLVYTAVISPAYAQTTSPSTSASNRWPQAGNSYQFPGPGMGMQRGNGAPFQRGGGPNGGAWPGGRFGRQASQVSLSVGQTITVTSTQGEYRTVGSASTNGTASGSVTFTVTGKLTNGYTLSLTSGSLTVAGTAYTISSGSAQMSPAATLITGQGTTSPTGQFIVRAMARGTFVGSSGTVSLDFTNGTTEYLVILNGSIQG